MPSRFGDDIIVYATTSKLAGLTTFEVESPIAGLPERATASCHKRLTLSVGKRASGSFNAAASNPASPRSAGTSSPPAFNASATPLTQKAAQLYRSLFIRAIALLRGISNGTTATAQMAP